MNFDRRMSSEISKRSDNNNQAVIGDEERNFMWRLSGDRC